jgi:hypothetical protein
MLRHVVGIACAGYTDFRCDMNSSPALPTQAEIDDESRRIRRLRIVVTLSLSVIAQGKTTYEEAQEMIASARRLAENLFPGKGYVFDLLYQPQFRRLINQVYLLQ